MRPFSSVRFYPLLPFSLFIILGMLSSFGARAFTAARAATRSTAPAHFLPKTTALFMSSEPDTSVVEVCTQKIVDALETPKVKVTGAYDDPNGSHISIEVVSSKFEGKRPMQRQQLVYKAIWEELQGPVHAGMY
jgi:stress-induced morphogen